MRINLNHNQQSFEVDLSKPIDISLSLDPNSKVPKCFYAPDFKIAPYQSGDFIGSVKAGAPVNFYNVSFNPHGNGTHTECMGHISDRGYTINQELQEYHFMALLLSVTPEVLDNGDKVISKSALRSLNDEVLTKALIIRTLPNASDKTRMDYSGTNPCYFTTEALAYLVELGIEHLIIDLPSVDREEDDGALAGHKVFWAYPSEDRLHCTITEMIYVPDQIIDGMYFLNMQIPSFEMDAAPSKIVLYNLISI